MSEADQVKKNPIRPWQWPGEWFRDEKFWREVTARALSGIIVLFLGYWAALFLGYVRTPSALKTSFDVSLAVAFIIIIVVTFGMYAVYRPSGRRLKTIDAAMRVVDRGFPLSKRPSRAAGRYERFMKRILAEYIEIYVYFFIAAICIIVAYFALWGIFSLINILFGLNQPLRLLFF